MSGKSRVVLLMGFVFSMTAVIHWCAWNDDHDQRTRVTTICVAQFAKYAFVEKMFSGHWPLNEKFEDHFDRDFIATNSYAVAQWLDVISPMDVTRGEDSIHIDGWGRNLKIVQKENVFEIRSLGADGKQNTSDDIVGVADFNGHFVSVSGAGGYSHWPILLKLP